MADWTSTVDEWTAPLPHRLRGRIHLQPQVQPGQAFALDAAGRHHWQPIAPHARVALDFDTPQLRWQGDAYLDANHGTRPLERDFSSWQWSRSALPGQGSRVHYEVQTVDGAGRALALDISAEGTHRASSAAAAPRAARHRLGPGPQQPSRASARADRHAGERPLLQPLGAARPGRRRAGRAREPVAAAFPPALGAGACCPFACRDGPGAHEPTLHAWCHRHHRSGHRARPAAARARGRLLRAPARGHQRAAAAGRHRATAGRRHSALRPMSAPRIHWPTTASAANTSTPSSPAWPHAPAHRTTPGPSITARICTPSPLRNRRASRRWCCSPPSACKSRCSPSSRPSSPSRPH